MRQNTFVRTVENIFLPGKLYVYVVDGLAMNADNHKDAAVCCEKVFQDAYQHTMDIEGFFSEDPFGGETFMGIARYHHPSWKGWLMLDNYGYTRMPEDALAYLRGLVEIFYRANFWDRIRGNNLAILSAKIATEVFDAAVNPGVTRSGEFLQESLNLLNINKKLYPDIVVDGSIGPVTIVTLQRYLTTRPESPEEKETMLLTVFSFLRGGYYIQKMRENPEKEKYRGWFTRAAA